MSRVVVKVGQSRFAGRSDEDVMLEVQQGSERAFAELDRRFRPRMFRLAFRVLRHEDDARDAVQAAFLGIYKHRVTFRHDSAVSTWIYSVTFRETLMALRKRHKCMVSIDEELSKFDGETPPWLMSREPGPEAVYTSRQIGERIGRAIRCLNPTRRTVFVLLMSDGLSLSEISAKLGISHGAAKSRLGNARNDLRYRLRSLRA